VTLFIIMPGHNKTNIKGFTLLEILVAILILAIVLSTIYASFSDTIKNINYAESQADIFQMARIALERIQDDLECTMVIKEDESNDSEEDEKELEVFFGKDEEIDDRQADLLTFLSAKHLCLEEDDIYTGKSRIAYYVLKVEDEEGDKDSLVLYRADTPALKRAPEPKTGGLILCDGLYSVNFIYYDADGEKHDHWDSNDEDIEGRPPVMVSIKLEFINELNPEEPLRFETAVALPMAKFNDENE